MQLNKSYLVLISLLVFLLSACNKILDKTPQDRFSDELIWSDINLADRYLLDNYNTSITGGFGYLSTASITDESHDTHNFGTANYLQGNITSSDPTPFGIWAFGYTAWSSMYNTIQKLNIFLANIEKVPAAYPEAQQAAIQAQADRMKGEAIFLRAFCYHQLARNYGGVILITE